MVHFSGSRVQSGEIEFSPNPFRSTSFKDDLGKKILGASICQIVNRAIRLGEDIHLFFLLISRKCLLPYVGMRDILIRRTPHTPVLTRLEFLFLTICWIISLFLNILVRHFAISRKFSVLGLNLRSCVKSNLVLICLFKTKFQLTKMTKASDMYVELFFNSFSPLLASLE